MKLHYKGKYNLDPDTLPHEEHKPNAVMFKEFTDMKKFAIAINIASIAVLVLFAAPVVLSFKEYYNMFQVLLGCITPLFIMFPHEILHAVCFKKDVYLYTNLKQGMMFVIGTEEMSKSRFVLLSMLPNLIFGFIPYLIWALFPQLLFFGVFGALAICMGAGDYYNVFNAVTQVPKGAKIYMHKMNSYWYMP